ncbi:hypothetical protein QU487_22525 [Crenobacter sp. SG2305]|uniref:hypothetical protein n=1 Tax=Crenobacter oryzisoli TaxID=3056844 RepID=UPI0025AB21F3|nr:hypothetical protein [Crenobacter sp. SG2305]MDN0085479.1 hypothetical protein [Crenobacter sp. SG2305]
MSRPYNYASGGSGIVRLSIGMALAQRFPHASILTLEPVGVRALKPDSGLVHDFHIIEGDHSIHVCSAPSPTATASIEIDRHIAARAPLTGTEVQHEE